MIVSEKDGRALLVDCGDGSATSCTLSKLEGKLASLPANFEEGLITRPEDKALSKLFDEVLNAIEDYERIEVIPDGEALTKANGAPEQARQAPIKPEAKERPTKLEEASVPVSPGPIPFHDVANI